MKMTTENILKAMKEVNKDLGKNYVFTYMVGLKRCRHAERFAEPDEAEAFANGLWAGGAKNIMINGKSKAE